MQDFRALEVELVELAEFDNVHRAVVHAARDLKRLVAVKDMSASCALLRNVELFVPEDLAIGARLDDLLLTLGLNGIDDHEAIVAAINGVVLARSDAGSVFAVLARHGNVAHFDLGALAALFLVDFHPELAGLRLLLGIRHPAVSAMLVFAADLAGVAAHAFFGVNHEAFHLVVLPSYASTTQASRVMPWPAS